jgi:hypothetical protein
MEHLFTSCTRFHDILESLASQGHLEDWDDSNPLQEFNLNVSTEELLSTERAFTYADLYAMLGNEVTVAWLTPHASVVRDHGEAVNAWLQVDVIYCFTFSVDVKDLVVFALSFEHLLEICDVILRLLAVSVVDSVHAYTHGHDDISINTHTFAYLMEQCQSLKVLSLDNLEMDEVHIRVLDAYSRPGLDIVLNYCRITRAGASALAEVLGRNQGPIKLGQCLIDNVVLANGLRGNSRLKILKLDFTSDLEVRNRELLAIAGALRGNKGLVNLDLTTSFRVNDETWGAVCDSLKTHPTLQVLNLPTMGNNPGMMFGMALTPTVLTSRIQALVDMMKVNVSIHTIHLHDRHSEHDLFRRSVIPYLETNRFRPRLLAIQQTRPIPYRAKVLGRALLSARTDANCFWMLLSGNAEVAFPSTTAAGNLTTPATFAATGNVAPVVATASTTDASSVVASAAGQKRKACP